MKKTTSSAYKKDKFYESIKNAVNTLLKDTNVITPVDVFIKIGNLTKQDYENWRFAKVPYLEKAINCNLSSANRKLRILRLYAKDIGLKPSKTFYKQCGKSKKILLRFSKTGNELIEDLYSHHYIKHIIKEETE